MALIIGLTGGIATGKSIVTKMFLDKGIPVIETDKISRELLKIGTVAYKEVISIFSDNILLTNNEINRKKLGSIVFSNQRKRNQLNNVMHPRIKSIVQNDIAKHQELGTKLLVIDVPLLFETDFIELVDKTIVVYAPHDRQTERLIERDNIDLEYAELKIHSQMDLEEKVKLADYVIDNSSSILTTKNEFNTVIKELEGL